MDAPPDQVIRNAINGLRLVAFTYDGLERVLEPHDFGEMKGELKLFGYQIAGESRSGKLPDWRLVSLSKATEWRVLDTTFAGPREIPTGQHHKWERLLASARFRVLPT